MLNRSQQFDSHLDAFVNLVNPVGPVLLRQGSAATALPYRPSDIQHPFAIRAGRLLFCTVSVDQSPEITDEQQQRSALHFLLRLAPAPPGSAGASRSLTVPARCAALFPSGLLPGAPARL